MPQNVDESLEKLKAALETLIGDACRALHGIRMPVRRWTRIVTTADGTIQLPVDEQRPDPTQLMLYTTDTIIRGRSLKRLIDVIMENPALSAVLAVDAAGNPIRERSGMEAWLINALVMPFVRSYFEIKKEAAFDRKVVKAVMDQFMSALQTDVASYLAVSPLLNLGLEMESLDIAPGLRLRRLSTDELEKWLNPSLMDGPVRPLHEHEIVGLQCAVEASMRIPMKSATSSDPNGPPVMI